MGEACGVSANIISVIYQPPRSAASWGIAYSTNRKNRVLRVRDLNLSRNASPPIGQGARVGES